MLVLDPVADEQLRDRLVGVAGTLTAIARRLAETGDPDRPDLRAAIAFIRAAGDAAAASAASRRAPIPPGPAPREAYEQLAILVSAAEHLDAAVTSLEDPAAVGRSAAAIAELARRGDSVYTGALAGSRRWRGVHGRLELVVDRCAHAGRALARLRAQPISNCAASAPAAPSMEPAITSLG